jgi:[acyl-carrier-protein] S-malonyltransferase
MIADIAMFPGQGSQRPGMAAHVLDDRHIDVGAEVFDRAEALLGVPLMRSCLDGSAQELARTEITQPAIVATSIAIWQVLGHHGFRARAVAGHSLGEFAALVAAEVLTADSALVLARRRGELMAAVAERVPGAMAAVVGLHVSAVRALCGQVAGTVEVANHNTPLQVVVSGERSAVREVGIRARREGAERVLPLDVGAPFHCSLMATITDAFAAELLRHRFADPALPVISSVTGGYVESGQHARELLRRQLTGTVKWVDVLGRVQAAGWLNAVEVGPGKVLAGLVRQTVPAVAVHTTSTARGLGALLEEQPRAALSPSGVL